MLLLVYGAAATSAICAPTAVCNRPIFVVAACVVCHMLYVMDKLRQIHPVHITSRVTLCNTFQSLLVFAIDAESYEILGVCEGMRIVNWEFSDESPPFV